MFYRICLLLLFCIFQLTVFGQEFSSYAAAIAEAKKLPDARQKAERIDWLIQKAEVADRKDTVAWLYHSKGVATFRDSIECAIAATTRAVELRRMLNDTAGLGQSCYNLGYFYKDHSNNYRQAKQFFEEAVNLGYTESNKRYYLNSLIPLVQIERDFGDYARAIQHLDLGLFHYENLTELTLRDSSNYGIYLLTKGGVYNLMGSRQSLMQSLEYLERAQSILEQLEPGQDLANCYKEFGNTYTQLGDHKKALLFYQKTVDIYEQKEYEEELAGSYNNIGIELRKLGRYEPSIATLNKGLKLLTSLYGSGFHPAKAKFADNIADTYRDQGRYAGAMSYYHKALQHILPGFTKNDYRANPSRDQLGEASDKEGLLTYLGDKAEGWLSYFKHSRDAEHLQQALQTMQLADYLIDQMRLEHTAEESKLVWRQKVHSIYEQAIDVAYQLSDYQQAFYFLEKSKSILLLDGMLGASGRKLIPDSIASRELALNKDIIELKKALQAKPGDQELLKERLAREKELSELLSYLATTYPSYHELRYSKSVISLAQVQQKYAMPGRLFISYFMGDSSIYAMAISQQQVKLLRMVRDSVMEQTIGALISQFREASAILRSPEQYASTAYALYEQLLAPVLKQISGSELKELCLVLDGQLLYVPFEALLFERPSSSNLAQLPYLVRKYQLGYVYSLSVLDQQLGKSGFTEEMQVLALAPFANNSGQQGQLPYSGSELKGIKASAKGLYFLDDKASRKTFLERAGQFGVLHLSTHAAANTEEGEPFIFFNDQKLLLSDLYTLNLPATLVVLSACETGLGKIQTGEGVMSLARGFTFAGAQSLISSLWRVNDQSTADIFTSFYNHLKSGKNKNEALYQAKLDYLTNTTVPDDMKSPYYWAGFIYVGGDGPLTLAPPETYWWIWAIMIGSFFSTGMLLLLWDKWKKG